MCEHSQFSSDSCTSARPFPRCDRQTILPVCFVCVSREHCAGVRRLSLRFIFIFHFQCSAEGVVSFSFHRLTSRFNFTFIFTRQTHDISFSFSLTHTALSFHPKKTVKEDESGPLAGYMTQNTRSPFPPKRRQRTGRIAEKTFVCPAAFIGQCLCSVRHPCAPGSQRCQRRGFATERRQYNRSIFFCLY